MKTINMGVLYVMAHLVITLAIIVGYLFSLYTGHPDTTFQSALYVIIGYWFGAVGFDKIKNSKNKNDGGPQ